MEPPSRPARGAWVEIGSWAGAAPRQESRPARGAWVEIRCSIRAPLRTRSRPARGAWVEIPFGVPRHGPRAVAPRKGRVG